MPPGQETQDAALAIFLQGIPRGISTAVNFSNFSNYSAGTQTGSNVQTLGSQGRSPGSHNARLGRFWNCCWPVMAVLSPVLGSFRETCTVFFYFYKGFVASGNSPPESTGIQRIHRNQWKRGEARQKRPRVPRAGEQDDGSLPQISEKG